MYNDLKIYDESFDANVLTILDGIRAGLKGIISDFEQNPEEQRRNIGRGYQIVNNILITSKCGIAAIRKGDIEGFERCSQKSLSLWNDLYQLRHVYENGEAMRRPGLPEDTVWRFDADAGQEVTEFFFVALFFPLLQNSTSLIYLTSDQVSYDALVVTWQTWLHGLADAVGDLGKIFYSLLISLSREARGKEYLRKAAAMRERFLKIAEVIQEILDPFETAYGEVINNTRRRGYGNTFRGVLGRVRLIIQQETQKLAEDHARIAHCEAIQQLITNSTCNKIYPYYNK